MWQALLDDAYKFLIAKPERKRPLGRPRSRGKDNIIVEIRKLWLKV